MPPGKLPWFPFFPNDWLSDNELQMAHESSIGIWINLICRMWWSTPRGVLSGPQEEIRKLAGCSPEAWQIFLEDVTRLKFADCTFAPDFPAHVTLTNRRMSREERVRELARSRQARKRSRDVSRTRHAVSPSPSPEKYLNTNTNTSCPAGAGPQLSLTGGNGIDRNSPEAILNWLNEKAGRRFPPMKSNLDKIKSLLKEGFLPEQIKAVISMQVKKWRGTDREEYLRPKTLFGRENFANYVGQLPGGSHATSS